MLQDTLKDDVKTILEAPFVANKKGSKFYKINIGWGDVPSGEFQNESVDLLITLYQNLHTQQDKDALIKTCEDSLNQSDAFFGNFLDPFKGLLNRNGDYIFMFLVKLGRLDKALDYFERISVLGEKLLNILDLLDCLLNYEPAYFNKDVLDRIRRLLENLRVEIKNSFFIETAKRQAQRRKEIQRAGFKTVENIKEPVEPKIHIGTNSRETVDSVVSQIKNIIESIQLLKLNILKSKLAGVNVEINQDKETLKNKIDEFGFNPDLNACLDKFDKEYASAVDEFDFKSCIAHVRSFTEQLVKSIALNICGNTAIDPHEAIDKIGRARNYLRDSRVNFLSKKQDDFLGAFYAFLSDDQVGAHSLGSNREHARIMRNMAVEQGLFLIKLLEKYLVDRNLKNTA